MATRIWFVCFHRIHGKVYSNGRTFAANAREALKQFKEMTPTAKRHFVVQGYDIP